MSRSISLLSSVFCFLFLFSIVLAVDYPNCIKYVTDTANVIEPEWKEKINALAGEIEKNTTNEIAVVTVKNLEGLSVEEYGNKLFQQCGIGKKEKNNGILILTAMDDRKWRIEVGYGLEGTINDARAGEIGRTYITEYFKQEKYGEGLYLTVEALNKYFKGEQTETFSNILENPWWWGIGSGIIMFVFVAIWIALSGIDNLYEISSESSSSYDDWAYPRKCPYCGYIIISIREIRDKKVCPKCGKPLPRKKRTDEHHHRDFIFIPIGYGDSDSGGSSGGGGGGFGGGSSGGGGASGGW